jgi:hypothetical protein
LPFSATDGLLQVVGVVRDALAELLVAALHVRVIPVDVLAGEEEELLVVGSLETVTARTIDCAHGYLLEPVGLWALTVVPCAPNLIALRRVSSNVERA